MTARTTGRDAGATTPIAYAGRIDLRNRWRGYLAVAVLLGLSFGLSLCAIAGARRTQSSYPRFLRSGDASTLSISSFGNFDQTTNDQIAAFPEVRQSRTYVGFQISVLVDGTVDASQDFEASGTFDGRYIDQDRFAPTSGRMFERDRVDEVVVNRFAADRYGYHVGQQLVLGTFELDPPGAAPESPPTAPLVPAQTTHVTIVGIGLFPDEVIQDDADRTPRLLLTPAFSEAARQYATYGFQGLVLKRGDADIDAVRERVAQITPPGTIELRITSDDEVHAQRATRPLTVALGAFGIITGLAGIVLVAQSLAGLMRRQRKERSGLRALGASPVTIIWISTVGPAVSIIGGTLLAVALAVAASPLMPIGPIRGVEVQRGIDLDAAVLGFGALVAIVILGPIAWLIARSQLPHRERVQPRRATLGARLVSRAASVGLPPTATSGLRFAFETDGTDATPSRSVIGGAVVAVTTLVASITFGASLQTLVDQPRLFGWNWDVAVSEIPLLGMSPESKVLPSVIEGRAIRSASEIVLGAATSEQLDKHIGDVVTLAGEGTPRDLMVVGIASLPAIGIVHATHSSLGTGALIAPEAVPGFDRDITGQKGNDLGPHIVFIRFRPGTDAVAELAHLQDTTQPLSTFAGLDVLAVQRPAEIVNSGSLGSVPVLLSSVLAIATIVFLGVALMTSVRRRRNDLLLLKALGLTNRQLTATISWQATIIVGIGLLVGMPFGVVLGRVLWQSFARQVHVVTETTASTQWLIGLAAAALALANLLAHGLARVARRVRPNAADPDR